MQNYQLGRNLTVICTKIYFTITLIKNHHAFIFVNHLYLTYIYRVIVIIINHICIVFRCEPVNSSTSTVQFNSVVNPTTTLCAALLLPTTATVVGNLLFDNSSYSYLQKTILVKIL